ncbi:MAG: GreA/GreB family elongation factor [Akkermansia sp.]
MHQEWGVGKVAAWSLAKSKIKIDFENKEAHVLGLKLAYNELTPIPEGHFLITCYDDPETCRSRAAGKDTLLGFIRMVLENNKSLREGVDEVLPMQPEDLEKFLSGRVVEAEEWKNWWEKARAAMRDDPGFRLPTRRGEPIVLRHAGSAAEALLDDCRNAKDLESCVHVLDQAKLDILKSEPVITAQLIADIEAHVRPEHSFEPERVLELIIIRDDILDTMSSDAAAREALDAALTEAGVDSMTGLADKLRNISSENIVKFIGELSAARQRRIFEALPEAQGDSWLPYVINIFLFGGAKVTGAAADFIIAKGAKEQLFSDLTNGISRQDLKPEVLLWICKERKGLAQELFERTKMALGAAIINAIEAENTEGGTNKALKLRNMLIDEKEKDLAPDLVTGLSDQEARPFAKAIYDCSAISELHRNALLALMMKVHPSLQEIVLARTAHKEKQNLYVSLRSFAARKAEYEDIVNVRIPKNKHDLEITRAEGDLRENGGYQDAKATRQVLMRRSEELSRLLATATPTDFSGATCETTGMGTRVTFSTDKGQEIVYTILGAWDSVPEERIISYSSKLGAKLIGHRVGDSLRLPIEIGGAQVKMTIRSIAPAPKELIYPDGEIPEA